MSEIQDEAYTEALAEIKRLKAQIETERRHYAEDSRYLGELMALCARAADALDVMTQFLLISDVPLEWEENKRRENRELIAELRKAAE